MANDSNYLRSNMRVARGLGSAKSGVHHWWQMKVTSVALIPLTVWFVYALLNAMLFPEVASVRGWLSSPFVALLMFSLIIVTFYHAWLGNQVIIEDYVKKPCCKYGMLLLNSFACFALGVIGVMAVVKLHFGS